VCGIKKRPSQIWDERDARGTTHIPVKKITGALSSTACAYTLVPITKNNFGLPTFQKMDFRSLLREDFPTALLVRLSPSRELADNSTNVLVPINAFD